MGNPAGTLHKIISAAIDRGRPSQNNRKQAREIWGEVLGLEPQSARFLASFARLSGLVERTRELVGKSKIGESQIGELDKLRAALDPTWLNQEWNNMAGRFENSSLVFLAVTSDVLNQLDSGLDLTDEDLAEIWNELRELIQQVEGSDLDEDLREFLLVQLKKCDKGLREHQFSGGQAAREAMESVLGALLVPPETIDAEAAKETEQFKSFWKWIGRLAQILGLAEKLDKLSSGEGFIGLLGS